MINESKVRLMTKAAMTKQKEERGAFRANRYDGPDYVTIKTIKGIIGVSFCYILILVLWALGRSEELLTQYTIESLITMAKGFVILYLFILVVTAAICVLVYTAQYWELKRKLRGYRSSIRKLNKMYQKEGKSRTASNSSEKNRRK